MIYKYMYIRLGSLKKLKVKSSKEMDIGEDTIINEDPFFPTIFCNPFFNLNGSGLSFSIITNVLTLMHNFLFNELITTENEVPSTNILFQTKS